MVRESRGMGLGERGKDAGRDDHSAESAKVGHRSQEQLVRAMSWDGTGAKLRDPPPRSLPPPSRDVEIARPPSTGATEQLGQLSPPTTLTDRDVGMMPSSPVATEHDAQCAA